MSVYLTSDLHDGHARIVEYCGRPFRFEEQQGELVRRWNVVVGPDDVVWILGDLSFRRLDPTRAFLEMLHGHKRLVRGNHDSRSMCRKLVESGHLEAMQDDAMLALDAGPGPVLCAARHAPDFETPWPAGVRLGLHGHCHEKGWLRRRADGRYLVNVGVDQWSFAPVSIVEILARVEAATDADVWPSDTARDVRRGLPSHYAEARA